MSLLYPTLERSAAVPVNGASLYPLGTPILTELGDGIIIAYRPSDGVHVVRLWAPRGADGSSLAYLVREKLKAQLKAATGYAVVTPYGDGVVVSIDHGREIYKVELDFGTGYFSADSLTCKAAKLAPMVEVIGGYVVSTTRRTLREGSLGKSLRDLTKEVGTLSESITGKQEFTQHMEALKSCANTQQEEIKKHLEQMKRLAEEDPDLERISQCVMGMIDKAAILKDKVKDTRTANLLRTEGDKLYDELLQKSNSNSGEDFDRVTESTQNLFERLTSDDNADNAKTHQKCKEVFNKVARRLTDTLATTDTLSSGSGGGTGGTVSPLLSSLSASPLIQFGKGGGGGSRKGVTDGRVTSTPRLNVKEASPQDVLNLLMGNADVPSNGMVLRAMERLVIAMLESTPPSPEWIQAHAHMQAHAHSTASATETVPVLPVVSTTLSTTNDNTTTTTTNDNTTTTTTTTTDTANATATTGSSSSSSIRSTTAAVDTPTPHPSSTSSASSSSSTFPKSAFEAYSALDIVESLRSGEMVTSLSLSLLRKAAEGASRELVERSILLRGGSSSSLVGGASAASANLPNVTATAALLQKYGEGQIELEDLVGSTLSWLDSEEGEEAARDLVTAGSKSLLTLSNHMSSFKQTNKVMADLAEYLSDPALEKRIRDGIEAIDADELMAEAEAAYTSRERRIAMLEKLKDSAVQFLMTTLPDINVPPIAGVNASGTVKYTVDNLDMSGFQMTAEDVRLLHPKEEEDTGGNKAGGVITGPSSSLPSTSLAAAAAEAVKIEKSLGETPSVAISVGHHASGGSGGSGGSQPVRVKDQEQPVRVKGQGQPGRPPKKSSLSPPQRGKAGVGVRTRTPSNSPVRVGLGLRKGGANSRSPGPASSNHSTVPGSLSKSNSSGSRSSSGGGGAASRVRVTTTSKEEVLPTGLLPEHSQNVPAAALFLDHPDEVFGVFAQRIQAEFREVHWSYEQIRFPYATGTGIANANVVDGSIKLGFSIKQGVLDEAVGEVVPLIVLSSREVSIERLDLEVSNTRMAWIINMLVSLFSATIKEYVCESLKESIDSHASELLGTVNTLAASSGGGQLLLAGAGVSLNDLPVASAEEIAMARGELAVECVTDSGGGIGGGVVKIRMTDSGGGGREIGGGVFGDDFVHVHVNGVSGGSDGGGGGGGGAIEYIKAPVGGTAPRRATGTTAEFGLGGKGDVYVGQEKEFTVCFKEAGPLGLQLDFTPCGGDDNGGGGGDDDSDDGDGISGSAGISGGGGGGGDGRRKDIRQRKQQPQEGDAERCRVFVTGIGRGTQADRLSGEESQMIYNAEMVAVAGIEVVSLGRDDLVGLLKQRPVYVTFRAAPGVS